MLHLTATTCPPFQTIILSHDYYRFSASQSETLLRKCLHVKNRIDKKIEGHFSI